MEMSNDNNAKMRQKVASYFSIKECNITMFKLWLNTLPERLRKRDADELWNKVKRRKAVLWTQANGFKIIK